MTANGLPRRDRPVTSRDRAADFHLGGRAGNKQATNNKAKPSASKTFKQANHRARNRITSKQIGKQAVETSVISRKRVGNHASKITTSNESGQQACISARVSSVCTATRSARLFSLPAQVSQLINTRDLSPEWRPAPRGLLAIMQNSPGRRACSFIGRPVGRPAEGPAREELRLG